MDPVDVRNPNPSSNNGRAEEPGDLMVPMRRLLDQVEGFVRERPGTAILCALGAGFLFGRMVRR